ncbi:MAG: sulfite exporter TauE/SafE family protein [Bacteroidota bacterium]
MLVAFTIASTLGMGGPLIVMPFLLLQFEAATAVALIVPVIWVNNVGRTLLHRQHINWTAVWRSGLLSVPLTLAAAFLTSEVPNTVLKILIIALIAYALASRYLFKVDLKVGKKGLIMWGFPIGLFTGLMGTSGPPMAIAYKGYGLVLRNFIATFSCLQIVLQLVRLPGYWTSGLLHTENLPLALYFAACGLPGIFLAKPFLHRIKPDTFRVAIDILLACIALTLLIDVLRS